MRIIRQFLLPLFFIALAATVSAQTEDEEYEKTGIDFQMTFSSDEAGEVVNSPLTSLLSKPAFGMRMMRESLVMEMHGTTLPLTLLGSEGSAFRSFVGFTAEQEEQFNTKMEEYYIAEFEKVTENPEATAQSPIFMIAAIEQGNVPVEELSEEALETMADAFCQAARESHELISEMLMEVLTPEQVQKMAEYQLAFPGELDVFSIMEIDGDSAIAFNGYEALDLTETQREEIGKIREEWESEYLAQMDEFLGVIVKANEQKDEISDENIQKEWTEKIEAIQRKIQEGSARSKTRVLALLTPEQIAKMEKILKEVPEEIARLGGDAPDDAWKKSWKPGDPVPEGKTPPKQRKPFPFDFM